jgi:hypothetical protein
MITIRLYVARAVIPGLALVAFVGGFGWKW